MRTPKFLIKHNGSYAVEYGATEEEARKAWARKNKIGKDEAAKAAMTCVSVVKPTEQPAEQSKAPAGKPGKQPKGTGTDSEVEDGGSIQ